MHDTGHLHDDLSLRALCSATDAFGLPSRQDNLPNTGALAEAAAATLIPPQAWGDDPHHQPSHFIHCVWSSL